MTSKIKIKFGQVEVEYEGSEEFIKQELPNLIKQVSDLCRTATLPAPVTLDYVAPPKPPTIQMSAGNIAAKLSCSKGPDLVLAAAASLTLAKNQEVFTRQQILDEMKAASSYYKSSYGGNLTTLINSLIKAGKLLERTQGQYALSANSRGELESRLAD